MFETRRIRRHKTIIRKGRGALQLAAKEQALGCGRLIRRHFSVVFSCLEDKTDCAKARRVPSCHAPSMQIDDAVSRPQGYLVILAERSSFSSLACLRSMWAAVKPIGTELRDSSKECFSSNSDLSSCWSFVVRVALPSAWTDGAMTRVGLGG